MISAPLGLVFRALPAPADRWRLGHVRRVARTGRTGPCIVACLAATIALASCSDDAATARMLTGGDPDHAKLAIHHYGCGTCHEIPGIGDATSHVGPSLEAIGSRLYLAGRVPNTPDHLIDWIRHPQSVEPGNIMPDMAVTERDARDIAAFLYTLR